MPANKPDLQSALATHPRWQVTGLSGAPELVKPIHNGLSNEVYLVRWGERPMVVRLAQQHAALGLDRQVEAECLRNAGQAGIAPGLFYQGSEPDILVTEYIDGHHWNAEQAGQVENIERLASLLKRIHALPAVDAVLVPEDVVSRYWRALATGPFADFIAPEVRAHLLQIMREIAVFAAPLVLCHNDLMLANIIDTGEQLYALDWEYASMGEPMFELAVIAHNHQLNPSQMQWLLQCYFGVVDDELNARFHSQLVVYLYLDCLWYAVQSILKPEADFAAIACAKSEVLSRMVATLDPG